jgi:hypothetical protein
MGFEYNARRMPALPQLDRRSGRLAGVWLAFDARRPMQDNRVRRGLAVAC